jgi:hypothetical protein
VEARRRIKITKKNNGGRIPVNAMHYGIWGQNFIRTNVSEMQSFNSERHTLVTF